MFCHRCGKSLPLESKFCNSCGIGIVTEQPVPGTGQHRTINIPLSKETGPAPVSSPEHQEGVIFRIRPSFYSIGTMYAGAALFSVLAIATFGYFDVAIGISLVLSLASFIYPLLRHLQRNRVIYTLTASKIEIDSGILSKTVRNIPLRNAQDVIVNAALFERMIGIGDVIIDSAAEAGKIQMRQIPDPRKHADLILQQVQRIHRLP